MNTQRARPRQMGGGGDGVRRPLIPKRSGQPEEVGEQQQQQALVRQVDVSGMRVEEQLQRERLVEAVAIHEGLEDLREVTEEFMALLEEQQDPIDTIEARIEAALKDVREGRVQIVEATEKASKCQKLLCFFPAMLTIIAVLMLIALFVKGQMKELS
uniref:Uncharacterized protein TCIL3000_11_16220 n=1 Tax=Trypanosoma congolense (strain IL3000) TaxID=1068625 RepID=G0V389_TRYCI|nr:unnamed protein product [Trypanosoma congolense IL3000]